MKFYKESSTNKWILGDIEGYPAGKCILYKFSNEEKVSIIRESDDKVLLTGSVKDFFYLNSSDALVNYTTYADFKTATADFFVKTAGGISSGIEVIDALGYTPADEADLNAETTERQNADALKANLVGGKVPVGELPSALSVGAIVQTTGSDTDKAMSQRASSDLFSEVDFKANVGAEKTLAVVVNDIPVKGSIVNYAVNNWTFVPTNNITEDCYITEFSARLKNAQVGRTVQFFVLEKTTTNTFKIKYIGVITPAELDGFVTVPLTNAIKAYNGQYIGVKTYTPNTANSIAFIGTGGPSYDYYGGWSINNATIALNVPQLYSVASKSGGYEIKCTTFLELKMKSVFRNVANGFLGINADGKTDNLPSVKDFLAGKKLGWIGTSIPAGGTNPYPKQVGELLNCIVDNQAAGSSRMTFNGSYVLSLSATIAELQSLDPAYVSQSYENKIIGKGFDYLVIDHGFNDQSLVTGDGLGTIDSLDKSKFYGAFNYVIQAYLADKPDGKIMFITPPNRYDYTGASIFTVQSIDNLRTALTNLALKYNAPILDLAIICNINKYNYTQYRIDGTHPLDSDLARLAYIIYKFILRNA